MTIKHFFKFIPVFVGRIKTRVGEVKDGYKKFRDVGRLVKMRDALSERVLEKERQNTDGSLKEAFGMKCQINIIDWILGKDVIRK